MSILGYCMLPLLILGFISIFMSLKNEIGILVSLGLAFWCSYSATDYIEMLLKIG